MKSFIAVFKIFLILLWTLPLFVVQICVLFFHKGKMAYTVPRWWHKGVCKIIGLKTEIRGKPVHDRQLIYVSNHISYLDIPAIGSYLKASFIAKEDIAGWPVIGFLARIQQTAFISRSSSKAKQVANALDLMVRDGKNLILFPEGTSTIGTSVMPFKSSLFSLSQPKGMAPVAIQPFILELIDVDGGKVLTPENRDLYAWYGDMDFAPHIWLYLQTKGATVRMTFLDVITPTEGQDRKELCKMIETQISAGLTAA
jgi:1-acyl-sn-glycerol-3-phosphate acyltransferase